MHSIQDFQPKSNHYYFICRGTNSKRDVIADNFDVNKSDLTHVGIGFIINKKFQLYHIQPGENIILNSIRLENLNDFINISDIYLFEIWEVFSDKSELKNLNDSIQQMINKKIQFDNNFNLKDEENYYCSEFVAKALNQSVSFLYKNSKIKSPRLLKTKTKEEVFEFYPVDFFVQNPKVKRILRVEFQSI